LKVQTEPVREKRIAGADGERGHEQADLVHQPRSERMGGKRWTADGEISLGHLGVPADPPPVPSANVLLEDLGIRTIDRRY
jgi:hypothetical protein